MENDVLYNRIMNVVHEEYGEGSTAVANPEGEPTDDLTSIQIGDEIYGISGGGGESPLFEVQRVINEDDPPQLNKTWKEIDDAIKAGKIPYFVFIESDSGISVSSVYFCLNCTKNENNDPITREVTFISGAMDDGGFEHFPMYFIADSDNDYPYQD